MDQDGEPYPVVAAVPAQRVAVADQLSPHFDRATVTFTEFAFGDTVVPVAPGAGAGAGAYFGAVPAVSPDGVAFVVQIIAEIDVESGVLSVILQALDPLTGLPPGPLVGVLPPEDGTGRGMGHFKFAVMPRPGTPDGTTIRNIAIIQFDANDVIPTNQIDPLDPTKGTDPAREALVTIDALAPAVVGGPTFDGATSPHRVTVRFSEDVRDSLSPASLEVRGAPGGVLTTPAGVSYGPATHTATYDLGGALPAGDYRLTLLAAGVADGVGHPLAADHHLDFTVRAGNVAPFVSQFLLAGGPWSPAFPGALNGGGGFDLLPTPGPVAPLPWANLDRIIIRFSEAVAVEQADLAVHGVNRPAYGGIPPRPT